MASNSILDKLEEGIVFRISRTFFLVLVLIGMLATIAGFVYFIWGAIPTAKEPVAALAKPDSIVLTVADIRAAMTGSDAKAVEGQAAESAGTPEETGADQNQQRFEAQIDSLKLLLPAGLYSWESEGGISVRLGEFFNQFSVYSEAIAPLEQLCGILREFPEDQRLAPFNSFLGLYSTRLTDYKRRLAEAEEEFQSQDVAAESEYTSAATEKAMAQYQGLIAVGLGIASVAFLGISLVLLSVQRNLKLLVLRDARS